MAKSAKSNRRSPPQPVAETYEMLWDCGYCGSKHLLGLTQRFCPSCGAPQDVGARYFPSEEQKKAVAEHQYAGADRVCGGCQTANRGDAEFCSQCGGPLTDAARAKQRADEVHGELFAAAAKAAAATPPDPALARKKTKKRIMLGVVIVAIVAMALYALLWSKPVAVTLQGHAWERSIAIEVYGPVQQSAWCDEMPNDARNVSRHREVRSHTQVPDGETCGTRRVDQGDGTFREVRECAPKYRQEPVYDQRCDYQVDRWQHDRTEKANGADTAPHWPKATPRNDRERVGEKQERYTWILQDAQGETHECPRDEAAWRAGQLNSRWQLGVGITGAHCGSLQPLPSGG